ncbi:cellulose synthase like G3 [Euphorbia peplus]|nr:cellulose synthase like G3 [Euphorbia peplus]
MPPLHEAKLLPNVTFNRIFAPIYLLAILGLFYHHAQSLITSKNPATFFTTLLMVIADLVLAFMWCTLQTTRLFPISRREFPENLVMKTSDFPGIDVFICTADPTKEPPMSVVNTALSVMAYDYPPEKLSVYVSDDGGSALTLFAFMEAAKFAVHWLPFCRDNKLLDRNPQAYFDSDHTSLTASHQIKGKYESMRKRVEKVVERGQVDDEFINTDEDKQVLNQYRPNFTPQNHPTVIQVLLEKEKNKDCNGEFLPNLIYVSREKSKTVHHHYKAGALNVLVRVSAIMTNSPIILTLDCDMYSNDPQTLKRVLCYYSEPKIVSNYAFIQFPQRFKGINKNDIYAGQFKRAFQLNPMGFDGLRGSKFVGTGTFFSRRALFGGPSTFVSPEIPHLSPHKIVKKPIISEQLLQMAHHVADCNYETNTAWGDLLGFRYGSLVEDIFTGYRLHCEGWRSIFCNPERAAFLGNAPISFVDLLNQLKRWAVGVYEIGFSRYSPIIYGRKYLEPFLTLLYCWYAFWPICSIPIAIYAFLPQLALLNNVSIFPKISESTWFILYLFLFLGSYGQDFYEFMFIATKGTFKMWWNDQRLWTIRGLTSLLFGSTEFFLKSLGIPTQGFNVTSKVEDTEQSKRYEEGMFEFGIWSPMLVTLSMATLINLVSFIWGITQLVFSTKGVEGLEIQMLISGFGMVNSWPIYEAMILRRDKGRMPAKVTIYAILFTFGLCVVFYVSFIGPPPYLKMITNTYIVQQV